MPQPARMPVHLSRMTDADVKEEERRETLGKRDRERASLSMPDAEVPRVTYNNDPNFYEDDDEEDDDSADEWQTLNMLSLQPPWECKNCTEHTTEDGPNCSVCGEDRDSSFLNQGFMDATHIPADFSVREEVSTTGATSGVDHGLHGLKPSNCSSQRERCTAIGYDERMLLHEETSGAHHPERPDRLRAIIGGLSAAGIFPGRCIAFPSREISRAEIELVHSPELVDDIETSSRSKISYFTLDTYANSHSCLAARLAAGTCADMATQIVSGQIQNGFALVRPPGHHAEANACMGFCLHNNVAIAARVAQKAGARKVLIVDWDVHHGNGTQQIFEDDPTVLFISLHRYDGRFYPKTGSATEVGIGPGTGFSVNIPWNKGGVGDNEYLAAFHHIVLPIARQFSPDFTIISAGFDAAKGDPLGGCKVTPLGYAHMTQLLNPLSGGKMLAVLEGGYNLRSISASAAAVVKVLLGESPGPTPENIICSKTATTALFCTISAHSAYWSDLQLPSLPEKTAEVKPGTELVAVSSSESLQDAFMSFVL